MTDRITGEQAREACEDLRTCEYHCVNVIWGETPTPHADKMLRYIDQCEAELARLRLDARQNAANAIQERALAVEGRVIAAERDGLDDGTISWLRNTARELRKAERETREQYNYQIQSKAAVDVSPPRITTEKL